MGSVNCHPSRVGTATDNLCVRLHPLIVNLGEVDVLASTGISVLFAAGDDHAAHGHSLTILTAPDGAAAEVLNLVGLDPIPDEPRG